MEEKEEKTKEGDDSDIHKVKKDEERIRGEQQQVTEARLSWTHFRHGQAEATYRSMKWEVKH